MSAGRNWGKSPKKACFAGFLKKGRFPLRGDDMRQETNFLESANVRVAPPVKARNARAKKNSLILRAFLVLDALRGPEEWLSSADLSQRAGLPKASGHRIIKTLEEIGAVVRGPHGRYGLGMLLVALSHSVAIRELLYETSNTALADLSRRLNLTVHMGTLDEGMVTYVAKFSTPTSFPIRTRCGSQLEAYCTGLGKVLLAALPDNQLENFIIDGDLVALTPYTITDRNALRSELTRIRRLGFAVDDRECQSDASCVAVAVRDADNRTVAAISGTVNAGDMTAERQRIIRHALLDTASAIGRRLDPRKMGNLREPLDALLSV
jgi:IclR family acetate operon transcriptional repressor